MFDSHSLQGTAHSYGRAAVAKASPILMATRESKQVSSPSEGKMVLAREVLAGQQHIHLRPEVCIPCGICSGSPLGTEAVTLWIGTHGKRDISPLLVAAPPYTGPVHSCPEFPYLRPMQPMVNFCSYANNFITILSPAAGLFQQPEARCCVGRDVSGSTNALRSFLQGRYLECPPLLCRG